MTRETRMKIVSFKICPFVQRVTALLEAKQKSYDIEYINLSNKPDWFLEKSPHGQVPILITDDGEALFESDAIVEYIEEVAEPSLFNKRAKIRAQERAWAYLATKNYLVQCSAQRSKTKDILIEKSVKLQTAFSKFESELTDTSFYKSNDIGMVDIAWLPLLHRANIIQKHSGYDFLNSYPRLKKLQTNIVSSGLADKSVSKDFEDKFTAFYLSSQTYLGQCALNKNGSSCCGDTDCNDNDFECCS